jgi:hypothetical protein
MSPGPRQIYTPMNDKKYVTEALSARTHHPTIFKLGVKQWLRNVSDV